MRDYSIMDIGSPEYDRTFWDVMHGHKELEGKLAIGRVSNSDTYELPVTNAKALAEELAKRSLPRKIAAVIPAYGNGFTIYQKDTEDLGTWAAQGEEIPIYEGIDDFTKNKVESYKLVSFIKLDEDFIRDATFPMEDYLTKRFAKVIGRTEEQAFIAGDGKKMPTGLIDTDNGAEVAVTTSEMTYDNIIRLYFSLEPEYRENARFIMNDKTALLLRTLKDSTGNYLWRSTDDTIFGKPVTISNFMPDAESGNVPVVFGDTSYYWWVCRKAVSIRALVEKFFLNDQIGYIGNEFVDGKLIRRKAAKSILMG